MRSHQLADFRDVGEIDALVRPLGDAAQFGAFLSGELIHINTMPVGTCGVDRLPDGRGSETVAKAGECIRMYVNVQIAHLLGGFDEVGGAGDLIGGATDGDGSRGVVGEEAADLGGGADVDGEALEILNR